MGTSTDAHCYACGYDDMQLIGSGRTDMETNLRWPIICNHCQRVTTANLKASIPRCNKCESSDLSALDDPANFRGDGGAVAVRWGKMELRDFSFLCPKCSAFEMRMGTNPTQRFIDWD